MGLFIGAAIILICIFILRKGMKATLYFALACLAMALRTCIQTEAWTSISFLSGNAAFMLEYMSLVLLTIFLTLYLAQSLKTTLGRIIKTTMIAGSLIYGACLLLADSLFYTWALQYYQMLIACGILCGVTALFWKLRHPLPEQTAFLYGLAVFYMAALSDILMYNGAFSALISQVSVSEMAMLVFVLAQTLSLFLMNNRLVEEANESQKQIASEKEGLEGLNRMQTQFLTNSSHEMRTPLTVISVNVQTAMEMIEDMKDEASKREAARLLKNAQNEIMRLSRMVGSMLRLASMRERTDKQKLDLSLLLQNAAEVFRLNLAKRGNILEVNIEEELYIFGNADLLAQVLTNILQNASTHTQNGMVHVTAQKQASEITVSVKDTGTGLSAELLPHVFERGVSTNGTGFGLYLCKAAIESHGGRIWIEGAQGNGTSVYYTLPVYEGQFTGA